MVSLIRPFLALASLLIAASAGAETEVEVVRATDLREEAAQMREQRTPLLLMFYADHCVYCMRMEEEFLKPMQISGDYDGKVVIRRVKLDDGYVLRDFDGARISGADLAARYNVFVTPTLVFLDTRGGQLADKMVGLSTPDFFGGYLDAAIDTALVRLRGRGDSTAVAGRIDPACNPLC